MDVKEALSELGLSKNETAIYLALCRAGQLRVSELSPLVGMHRPNIYDALRQLELMGLASAHPLNGMKFYRASEPEALKEALESKMELVEKLGKELLRAQPENKEIDVAVYTGGKALRTTMRNYLKGIGKSSKEGLVFGVDERSFMSSDTIAMEQFFSEMKKKGLKEKVLVAEGEKYLPAPKETTEYRGLAKEYFDSATSFQICGNMVSIIVFSEPLCVITIRSSKVANAYRKKFWLLWKYSKKIKR